MYSLWQVPRRKAAFAWAFLSIITTLLTVQSSIYTPFQPPRAVAQGMAVWQTFAQGDDVRAIAVQLDTVWAGTAGGGLVRWDTPAGTYDQLLRPQDPLPGNDVRDLAIDYAGNLWAATDRGLVKRTPSGVWTLHDADATRGGLSSDDVTAVAVGSGDTIWVGMAQFWDGNRWTGGGVARLQNNQWTAYSVQDGLASANVTDIAIDPSSGDVWVTMARYWVRVTNPATGQPGWVDAYGGISRFHSGVWTSYRRQADNPAVYPRSSSLNAVSIDGQGRRWFATDGRGLEVLEGDSTWYEFTTANGLAGNWVLAVSVDSDDRVWAAAEERYGSARYGRGVSILDHKGTLSNTSDDEWRTLNTENGLPSDSIRAVVAVTPDLAWLGASDPAGDGFGLVRYQSGVLTTFSATDKGGLPSNMITAVAFDTNGRAWVGTASRGVGVWDGERWTRYTKENTNGGLGSDLVRAITVDGAGRVWAALDGETFDSNTKRYADGGVSVFDGTQWHRHTLESTYTVGAPVTEVRASVPVGRVLVPVGFAGAAEANQALASHYVMFEGDDTLYSYVQYDDWNGAILVAPPLTKGIPAGTAVKSVHAGLAENRAMSIAYGLGKVWIGTGSSELHEGSGLSVYDTQAHKWDDAITSPPLPSDVVTGISFSADTVWVAATHMRFVGGGVGRGERGGTHWTTFTSDTASLSICHNDVRSIAVDGDGNVWAGGFSGPRNTCGTLTWPIVDATVNRFRDGVWQHWTFADDGYVSALAVDGQGRPWLGTSRDGLTPAQVRPARPYSPRGGVRVLVDGRWLGFHTGNSGLAGDDIRTLAIAPNGERWIGTWRSGISVLIGEPAVPDHELYMPFVAGPPGLRQMITDFHLSGQPGGPAQTIFPSGTTRLYATASYEARDQMSLGVDVCDPRGTPLYSRTLAVAGRGTAVFEISGPTTLAKFQDLVTRLGPPTRQLLDEAIQATQRSIRVEKGVTAIQPAYTMANSAAAVAAMVPGAAERDLLGRAEASLREVVRLGQELATRSLSDDQVADHLRQMRSRLDEGLDLLTRALVALGDGSSLVFGDTPPGESYLANVRQDGNLAASIEWRVGD